MFLGMQDFAQIYSNLPNDTLILPKNNPTKSLLREAAASPAPTALSCYKYDIMASGHMVGFLTKNPLIGNLFMSYIVTSTFWFSSDPIPYLTNLQSWILKEYSYILDHTNYSKNISGRLYIDFKYFRGLLLPAY